LAISVTAALVVALALPFTPLAGALGFVRPPVRVLAYVAVVTGVYLLAVEGVKRRTMKRLFA